MTRLVVRVQQIGDLRPDDVGRRVAQHPARRRALVERDRALVDDGDQVERVVHERAEAGRLLLGRAPQQQAHADGRQRTEQSERDLDAHEPGERVARDARLLGRGVAGHARELCAGQPHEEERRLERRARPAHEEQRVAVVDELVDEVAFVGQLDPDRLARRRRNRHEIVEVALRRRRLTSVQERVGGHLHRPAVFAGVGLVAVDLEDQVLDVALHVRALARGHGDHQGRPALLGQPPRVVRNHRRDQHDERRDDRGDLLLPFDGVADATQARQLTNLEIHQPATVSSAYMPPR